MIGCDYFNLSKRVYTLSPFSRILFESHMPAMQSYRCPSSQNRAASTMRVRCSSDGDGPVVCLSHLWPPLQAEGQPEEAPVGAPPEPVPEP